MSNVERILLVTLAVTVLCGCPRRAIDLCSGDDPHPECECQKANPDPECSAADMGGDMGQDAGDVEVPETGPDVTVPCDGACADPTPVCDESTNTCVACLDTPDCAAGVCTDDLRCVECVDSTDCAEGVCNPADNTCVACLTNDECAATTASLCDTTTNTCTPCATSADCTHLTDTTVCDAGECVECTGTEYGACTGVCDSRLRTCTDTPPQMSGLCEACVSDAQCRPGMLCVPMTFAAAEVGTYCLWRIDATELGGPNGACSTVRPYIDATESTSLDGTTVEVCGLRTTTCPGLTDFDSTCTAPGANDECGAPGFDDGFCVMFDAATNLCTVPCGGNNDCETGFDCDTTVTPRRCEL